MKKKKFLTPTITRVQLDREQAVLQQCSRETETWVFLSNLDECLVQFIAEDKICVQMDYKTATPPDPDTYAREDHFAPS